jgi:hypothetical protein
MKKLYSLIASCLFLFSGILAQSPNLVVEIQNDNFSSGLYEHRGKYNGYDYWVGPKGMGYYAIYFGKNPQKWSFAEWQGDTFSLQWGWANRTSTSTDKYPTSGWGTGMEVNLEGPALKYSGNLLTESFDVDGSFTGKISITHNRLKGQGFNGTQGSDLVSKGGLSVSNVPDGLTAKAIVVDSGLVEFSLTGSATTHNVDTAVVLTFKDAAFANNGKADSTAKSTLRITINFINKYTVAKTGGDFDSIAEAIAILDDGDGITIKEGTYTEFKLKPNANAKSLIIRGEGPDKTIIQGADQPFKSVGMVFDFQGQTEVNISNLTIQNGDNTSGNGQGGGINGNTFSTHLIMDNCRILNNRAFSSSGGQTSGGGVICARVTISNSEFSGNVCDNSSKAGQVLGGALAYQTSNAKDHSKIINTTFAKNFSRSQGGAIFVYRGYTEIINCTFSENEAVGFLSGSTTYGGQGGAVYSQDTLEVVNTISWNNTSYGKQDFWQHNGPITLKNSIINNVDSSGSNIKILGSYKQIDPKLDTLAFNCSPTRTYALLEGSPALDSAMEYQDMPQTDQRGYSIIAMRDIGAHESNNFINLEIGADTLCMEDGEKLTMKGYPNTGTFEGEGVSGNTFDPTAIKKEGWVTISYKFSAPGCLNTMATDSIYVKVCKVNSTKNMELPVSVYPNPAQSKLTINNLNGSIMNVRISDISGKTIQTLNNLTAQTELNVESLPNGIYFLSIQSQGKTAHVKFVKN